MKKFLLFYMFCILGLQNVFASEVEVLPTMTTRTMTQDRVWVGTFNIAWNKFMDDVVHTIVRFPDGTPIMAQELNRQEFDSDNLSKNSYYTYVGKIKNNTKQKISRDIRKKFKQKSDILNSLNLKPAKNRVIIYSMLNKNFTFNRPFDKLGVSTFGESQQAEYFGIGKNSDKSLVSGVQVLFYNSPEDFAVKLSTVNEDEVYLYRTVSNKSFKLIFDDMNKSTAMYLGNKKMRSGEELKVPNLKFFVEKKFEELQDKRVKGTRIYIDDAVETVNFVMDNTGVKLKSEAAITATTTALLPEDLEENRYFYYDDTFVVFLKQKDKTMPYFALRVNDIRNFQ